MPFSSSLKRDACSSSCREGLGFHRPFDARQESEVGFPHRLLGDSANDAPKASRAEGGVEDVQTAAPLLDFPAALRGAARSQRAHRVSLRRVPLSSSLLNRSALLYASKMLQHHKVGAVGCLVPVLPGDAEAHEGAASIRAID